MDIGACFHQFEKWFSSNHGLRLQAELHTILQDIDWHFWSGTFLQIGSLNQNPWHHQLPLQQQFIVAPGKSQGADLQAHPLHLPFASQSIEVLFSPFTLDLGLAQMPLLYEYDRVLKSMGIVIFVGVNRLGLWKLSRLMSWGRQKSWYQQTPGHSYWHLRHQMSTLGYHHYASDFFHYLPPVQSKKYLDYFEGVHRIAKFIAPYPPSFYYLIMQKQEASFNNALVYAKTD